MKRLLLAAAVALSSAALAQGGTSSGTAGTESGAATSTTTAKEKTTTKKKTVKKKAAPTEGTTAKEPGKGGAGAEGTEAGGAATSTTTKKSTTTTTKKKATKKKTEGTKGAAEPGKGGAGGEGMEPLGITLPSDAGGFLDRVYAGNQREIQVAQLAEKRSQDSKVKELAQMLVKDHTALGEKLQQVGKEMNHKFTEPKPADDKERTIMDAHSAVMKELDVLEGEAFDDAFLATMVQHHDMDIAKFGLAINQYKDPQLTAVLKSALPTLNKHRARIYSLLGKEKPQVRTQARTRPMR